MNDIEKVIEQLKQVIRCDKGACDITCRYYEDYYSMECYCNYDIPIEEAIDNAIQTIRELQNQNAELLKNCFLLIVKVARLTMRILLESC